MLDYISQFRERLHHANSVARKSLSSSQTVMKRHFDCSAVPRHFERGDKVLALLPIPGSSLSAKFSGPYEIRDRLSDTDYVIGTPERRRKTRVCHVNMLKLYHSNTAPVARPKKNSVPLPPVVPGGSALVVSEIPNVSDEDADGVDHPVCYFSRKFHRQQLHYSTI